MRVIVAAAASLLVGAAVSHAHPGVGIVMDSRRNVYYTDLEHVWRIAPDGRKSVAVRNVHTHELHLDAADNLYGEHLWYEGEQTDRWGHYVWRLRPGGTLDTVVAPREGFLRDYSFVRDRAGNMYWVERTTPPVVRRRSPDGRVSDFSRGPFRDVGWMTVSPDGVVYLIDDVTGSGELRRIDASGAVTTIVRGLASSKLLRPWAGGRHRVMGVWLGPRGDVYVASYATGEVKRVSPAGEVRTVARARYPWAPSGGLVTPDGDLWILEYATRGARVRRVRPDGTTRTY